MKTKASKTKTLKTKTSRSTTMLSTIARDADGHLVTDDLAGLEQLVPEAPSEREQFVIFRNQLPALLDLRGRGQAHTIVVGHLIKLLSKEPHLVETWIDIANALTVLTNSAHLALMLLPVRSDDDAWTREDFGRHLLNRARAHGDRDELATTRRAVGKLPKAPTPNLARDPAGVMEMITTMARRAAALNPPPSGHGDAGRPGVYTLQQAESLEAFFGTSPDLGALLDEARALLMRIDGWQADGVRDETDAAAIEGARILAYARLMRVALWPARSDADIATKIAARNLVAARDTDPDRFRALWDLAFGQGETIAGQSERFRQVGKAD
ncbi:hypothetical protein [Bosea sp. (in: a-proteobacteria)]|jgi:hypothetical protein|uniref:hypothetical protein n=1 Tax=Bosea sp. (in: a-proteobacteria) TaxID=1871050 RepID=UPI00356A3900